MSSKLILALLSYVMSVGSNRTTKFPDNSVEFVKEAVRAELSRIAFKLLVGSILVSGIAYALVQLGRSLRIFLNQYQNAYSLEVLTFSGVLVGCSALLYALFKDRLKTDSSQIKSAGPLMVADMVQNNLMKFSDGFMRGLKARKPVDTEISSNLAPYTPGIRVNRASENQPYSTEVNTL